MTAKHRTERRKGTPRAWVARGMRLPLIIAAITCSFAHADESKTQAAKTRVSSKEQGLRIDVRGSGWGTAQRESIETVLYAVADELLTTLPKNLSVPIVVTHTDDNPVALYERGPAGEYQVHLHAKGENWHLFAYEFAHELCHIISNYDENVGADTTNYNQWFEESLCETASLYTLERLAADWERSPQWAPEAERLQRFFAALVSERHRQLPPQQRFAAWLRSNEGGLRGHPYQREKNDLAALALLPLFEQGGEAWEAVGYLNLDPHDADSSLPDYLRHWYVNAPGRHKAFVAGVLGLFGMADLAPAPVAAAVHASAAR